MLNYAETASSSTIVPLALVLQSQCQQDTAHHISSVFSYAIGPIDPAQLISLHAHLSTGEECPLLTPARLPLWILSDPAFRDGYEQNYYSEEEEEEWTVSQLVNLIYAKLRGDCYSKLESLFGEVGPDFGPWEVGWLLRDLTRLAETNRTLALTGIAHLCFLLSFLPQDPPTSWPPAGLIRARWLHNDALKAYRARVRVYREQGKSFAEAQRLALC
jgi:hypothetical protein